MCVEEHEIDSPASFLSYCNSGACVYRGQGDDWRLIPSIGRLSLPDPIIKAEIDILQDFLHVAPVYIKSIDNHNTFEKLAIAQHHGLPTRLLDWTRNPLVALWFCVVSTVKMKSDYGVVWVLNPYKTIMQAEKNISPFAIKIPVMYNPRHINSRIIAQSGVFTAHPLDDTGDRFLSFEDYIEKEGRHPLQKLIISKSALKDCYSFLGNVNINSHTLFPGIDGLCNYLKEEYTESLFEE